MILIVQLERYQTVTKNFREFKLKVDKQFKIVYLSTPKC